MQERFYALDKNNYYREFNSKRELVKWITNRTSNHGYPIDIREIGNNFNDTYRVDTYHFTKGKSVVDTRYYRVDYVVYDSIWRVVHTDTLIEWIVEFFWEFSPY